MSKVQDAYMNLIEGLAKASHTGSDVAVVSRAELEFFVCRSVEAVSILTHVRDKLLPTHSLGCEHFDGERNRGCVRLPEVCTKPVVELAVHKFLGEL